MTFTAMSFATWGTLFASIGGVVTLLYMLRLRRRRIEVPFGPLWQKVLSEKQTTSLFRVLKRYFSLLMQLAFIALVLTAVADPQWTGIGLTDEYKPRESQPHHTLLVVDTSASMGAVDVEGGRMGKAIEAAHQVVGTMRPNERVMLAQMHRDVVALSDWTEDRDLLHQMIGMLRPHDIGTDVAPVMQFARNAVRGLPNSRLILVTDREFAPPDEQLAASIHLEVVPVGSGDAGLDNVSLLDFNVRSHLGMALKYALYYKLKNNSRRAVKVAAYLYSDPTGEAQTREDFTKLAPVMAPFVHELAPGEEKVVEKLDVDLAGSRAALIIAPFEDSESAFFDVLPADDAAFAVVPQRRDVKVLMVGEENFFLQAALVTRQNVTVDRTTVDDYASAEGYDLVVFNGKAAETPGPGNHIFINSKEGGIPYAVKGEVPGGEVKVPSSVRLHPLMRFVQFVELEVPAMLRFKRRSGQKVMARAKGGKAAILTQVTPEQRWIAVGFDPLASEWVGHYSFSIFFVNAINWFFREEVKLLRPWSLARRWDVRIPWMGVSEVQVTLPSGAEATALVDGGGTLAYTGTREGIYEVRHPDPKTDAQREPVLVAAALRSPAESRLEARGDYPLWRAPEPELNRSSDLDLVGADLWQLLVMAAICLVAVEWFTYHRRWTV